MRRWIGLAVVLLALGLPRPGMGEEIRSGFGFGISVPEVWLVLTRAQVAEHSNLFLEADGSEVLEAIPEAVRRVVFRRIEKGELEIFYRREGHVGGFVDNVNIMRQRSPLPESEDQLRAVCELLPGEFSRVFGRPIAMDVCELRERLDRRALYLQFDGAIPGTKTMQYQVEQDGDQTLVLTATSAAQNVVRMLGEFESMLASIRLD